MQSANINKSLLALSRVIQHLADGAHHIAKRHVPYRESNLTRLLQPVLGGNSATTIIAAIAPGRNSIDNTKATLQFISVAATVCTCNITAAVVLTALRKRPSRLRDRVGGDAPSDQHRGRLAVSHTHLGGAGAAATRRAARRRSTCHMLSSGTTTFSPAASKHSCRRQLPRMSSWCRESRHLQGPLNICMHVQF